jgi:hypothetical protein
MLHGGGDVLGPLFRLRGHRPGEEAIDGSMEVREPSFEELVIEASAAGHRDRVATRRGSALGCGA